MKRLMDLDGVIKPVAEVIEKILGKDKNRKRRYAEDEEKDKPS